MIKYLFGYKWATTSTVLTSTPRRGQGTRGTLPSSSPASFIDQLPLACILFLCLRIKFGCDLILDAMDITAIQHFTPKMLQSHGYILLLYAKKSCLFTVIVLAVI
jgi:hypothetical protein